MSQITERKSHGGHSRRGLKNQGDILARRLLNDNGLSLRFTREALVQFLASFDCGLEFSDQPLLGLPQ
jgi:hypothetical protein